MSVILLVRHGENNWVKENKLAGWTPGVVLNDNGHKQAVALAERLAHLPIKAIYSSPLERCVQTAEHLAEPLGLDIIDCPQIGEVKYGEWEGEPIKALSKKKEWHTIQHVPSRFAFPGGESLRGVQTRAVNLIEALAAQHSDEMVIVVGHADVIKLILAHYVGAHIDLFQRIGLSPASVSVLGLGEHGGIRVMRINDDGPIKAPPKKKKDREEGKEKRSEDSADSTDTTQSTAEQLA